MRKIRFIILALLVLCLALIFASCDPAGGTVTPDGTSADSTGGTTGTSDGTASEPLAESDGAEIVNAPDFDISGTALSAVVSNATETFSFINRITVSPKATWQVSTDLQGVNVIPTKTVPLNAGDNVFYILVTSGDGEGLSLYTVTVRRRPTYTVAYDLDGGTGAYTPQQVEEGTVITPEDPTRACYEFAGWDADLTAPVTGNMTVKAKWTLAGHTWPTEYTVDVPASCTQTGTKHYTCTVCGAERTETIEKTEHRWKTEYTVDVAATCTAPGFKSIYCRDCNAQKPDSSVVIQAEHTPETKYTIDLKPTCCTPGEESLYCAKCEQRIESSIRAIPIDPNAHYWNTKYTIDVAATCTTPGSKSVYCLLCDTQKPNSSVEIPIDPSGHRWDTEFTVDIAATCTTPGSKSVYCLLCEAQKPNSSVEIPINPDAHYWDTEYTVDIVATCSTPGIKSIHCLGCNVQKPDSSVEIPRDPNAHIVDEWKIVEPTLLNPDGSRTGTCLICEQMIVREETSTPIVYLTNWNAEERAASPYSIDNPDDHKDTFGFTEHLVNVKGDDHFYGGNDLLIEFSFLYNSTMANASQDGTLAVMYIENNNLFNVNLKTGKITASERAGDVFVYPTPEAIALDSSVKTVDIGAYGWHRFSVRIHQDAVNNAGEVEYTVIATAYLDGVKVLELDKTAYALSKHNGSTGYTGLLYTATVENDELVYADLGSDMHCDVYVMVECIYANQNDANAGYVIVGDVSMTCGADFVQNVVAVADPIAATLEVAGGVELPAAFYYKIAA